MKKLKIEAGKFYRTRDGRKAGIYRTDVNNRKKSIHGYIINPDGVEYSSCWYGDGRFFETWDHSDDLISEWQEESLDFDWSVLPKWRNGYIAMDKYGAWSAYSNKPKPGSCCFYNDYVAPIGIPRYYQPKNFTGDWTDSVFKNPNLD